MLENDKREFAEIYRGICATYGREASTEAMRIAWMALAAYSMEQVRNAYAAHVTVSKFMPTPAEVLDHIQSANSSLKRPGADEAWLMTPPEESSYWATEEMLGAWAVVAEEMYSERPDKIAARMAFKDAYNRLVDHAKAHNRPVRWQLIRGIRNDNLEDTIREGVRLGYMPREEADDWLRLECQTSAGLLPLLEGAVASHSDVAREAVAALKRRLSPPQEPVDWERVHADLAATEHRIAAALRRTGTNG